MMAGGRSGGCASPARPTIQLYKNNTDGKGASYGSHENYLMDRKTPFIDIIRGLIPFFVTRQVFAGAGRVGIGTEGARRASSCRSARTSSRSRSAWRRR